MDKLKLHTPDYTQENIARLTALFPSCVTETQAEDGSIRRAIDFDALRQELSDHVVDGPRERYHLNWPGKREALLAANAPIAKTLRPCREESVDFETTKNLFIVGDNLDALKLLQETYLNKVKMIYIDPPYNTGKEFIYDDDFGDDAKSYFHRSHQKDENGSRMVANPESNGRFHSDWLTMMYSRLRLARTLLRDDGVIFISIDDGEIGNLRKLCDEVFGDENSIALFVWEKRTTRENRRVFSFSHEYVLCVARQKEAFEQIRNPLPTTDEVRERYSNPDNDPRGPWQSVSLNAQAGHATKAQFYSFTTPGGRELEPPPGRCWAVTKPKMQELIADGRVWFGETGNNVPRRKLFLSEAKDGLTPHTLWKAEEVGTNDSAKKDLISLFDGVEVFDTPKPIGLIRRMLEITTDKNDVVVDFFAGSGTTAHAVMELNGSDGGKRRHILVQLADDCGVDTAAYRAGFKTIAEIAEERIRRAGKKVRGDAGLLGQNLDIGFRVLKVDTSNMKDVYYKPDALKKEDLFEHIENIKEDRTPEDLLFQVLLDWGVDLSLPIAKEMIDGKTVFFVDQNALAACFDTGVTEDLVKKLAARKPLRAVFRDAGYGSDAVKINVEQIFKLVSPGTEVKAI